MESTSAAVCLGNTGKATAISYALKEKGGSDVQDPPYVLVISYFLLLTSYFLVSPAGFGGSGTFS
jgi:hypothetical protein